MIKARFGSKIDGWIQAVFPFLFKRPVNPNLLTMLGTLVSVGAAAAFALGHFVLGGFLLLFGGIFDLVDGVVARHFEISTQFGALLDSSMDRLVDMVVLLGILLHYAAQDQPGIALLAAVVLVASVMTSYTKARAEQFMPELKGGLLERGERIVAIVVGGLSGLMIPILWLLAIGSTYTVIQRFSIAYRAMAPGPKQPGEVAPSPSLPEHP